MTWKTPGRSTFDRLRSARTARSGPITISWLPAPSPQQAILAFAIPKRVGKAVVRNRLRRRLREVARLQLDLPSGVYLVRARPAAATLNFEQLGGHMAHAAATLVPPRPKLDRR